MDDSFSQKQERSDSNDILGTYFRPRRAAELIHQNKVLNCWKGNNCEKKRRKRTDHKSISLYFFFLY